MMIDFDAPILDLKGNPIQEAEDRPLTLASACASALMMPREGDERLDGSEKLRRLQLAIRVQGGGQQDCPAEEIVLLKSLIASCFTTLVSGRAWQILDPA